MVYETDTMAMPGNKGKQTTWAKFDFQTILLNHIERTNAQLTKLPHENTIPNYNAAPTGTTYSDIAQSYYNLVVQLEKLLKPYHDDTFKAEIIELEKETKTLEVITFAMRLFGLLMELCHRQGYLLENIAIKVSVESD